MDEQFMGEVKPFYGKWNWPLGDMQPGMYFVVDHARRAPEAVRSYVSMQGARTGKYFSINANDPERPGFCRVTCTLPPTQREEPNVVVMDIEKAHPKMAEWYGVSFNEAMPWGVMQTKSKEFVKIDQVAAPPVERMIVRTSLFDGWIGLVFRKDGFEAHGLPAGTSSEAWKPELQLDEVMQ